MKEEKDKLNEAIVRHSYIDISKLGPELAKYISLNMGEKYEYQPNALMYAKHSIPYSDHNWDENIIINYFLIIKEREKRDSYKREYNKDLSDIEENNNGIILCESIRQENRWDENPYFRYRDDANGRSVYRDFRCLPFYCLGKDGKLKRVYENFGNMYDVIDLIIQKRVQLEETEITSSMDDAIKQYVKKKSEE